MLKSCTHLQVTKLTCKAPLLLFFLKGWIQESWKILTRSGTGSIPLFHRKIQILGHWFECQERMASIDSISPTKLQAGLPGSSRLHLNPAFDVFPLPSMEYFQTELDYGALG